jgi:uncharacterized protein
MIQELVAHVVRSLVEKPEVVRVTLTEKEEVQLFEIVIDSSERGRVIGRDGMTIKALRNLICALMHTKKKIIIELL